MLNFRFLLFLIFASVNWLNAENAHNSLRSKKPKTLSNKQRLRLKRHKDRLKKIALGAGIGCAGLLAIIIIAAVAIRSRSSSTKSFGTQLPEVTSSRIRPVEDLRLGQDKSPAEPQLLKMPMDLVMQALLRSSAPQAGNEQTIDQKAQAALADALQAQRSTKSLERDVSLINGNDTWNTALNNLKLSVNYDDQNGDITPLNDALNKALTQVQANLEKVRKTLYSQLIKEVEKTLSDYQTKNIEFQAQDNCFEGAKKALGDARKKLKEAKAQREPLVAQLQQLKEHSREQVNKVSALTNQISSLADSIKANEKGIDQAEHDKKMKSLKDAITRLVGQLEQQKTSLEAYLKADPHGQPLSQLLMRIQAVLDYVKKPERVRSSA